MTTPHHRRFGLATDRATIGVVHARSSSPPVSGPGSRSLDTMTVRVAKPDSVLATVTVPA